MTAMHMRTTGILSALALLFAGCAAFEDSTEFNRHRYTDIVVPREGGDIFYYDVTTSAEFPKDSPAAEAERRKWLGDWMKVRGMCAAGYEVLKIRPFDYLEDNPAHHDLRYEARCRPEPQKK
jgi:hypothetical protein